MGCGRGCPYTSQAVCSTSHSLFHSQVDGASEGAGSGGHIAQTDLGVGGWKLELPLEEWGPWFAHL